MENNENLLSEYLGSEKITQVNDIDAVKLNLTTDDEIWLVHCPKNINIAHLKGQKVKLPGKSSYDNIESISEEFLTYKQVSLVFPHNNIYCLHIRGNIVIRDKFKNVKVENVEDSNCNKNVPFPQELKERHPLLGADYQDKLLLNKNILKRLKGDRRSKSEFSNLTGHVIDISPKKIKKQKHRKEKRQEGREEGYKSKGETVLKESKINNELRWIKDL